MPRVMEITTPLGEDLLFHRMHGREEMSRPFEYQLDLLSPKGNLNLDEILGKNVTVKVVQPDDSTRFFNGFVTRFAQGGSHGRYWRYSAVVHPWLWFLTRTTDCRIFQDMTVPEIVKTVLSEEPTNDFKFELTSSYRKWTYCVQYRETDFNFISRLLEEEGIYYYVLHTDGHHTLVLTDSTGKHATTPGYETISFIPPAQVARPELEHISSWDFSREIQTGVYAHTDYDLERPGVKLLTQKSASRVFGPVPYEVYDYPGHYLQKSDGEQLAAVRIDEVGTQFETAQAASNSMGISVGALFTLEGFPREDQNREHVILAADYELEFSEYEAMPQSQGAGYRCTFVSMSSEQQFRPKRTTPKPFVQGPQTAVVVGPAGDEIYKDDYGRVKVQFHWDRYGKRDENSSCWIRVAQTWAGKGWGTVSTPRIGHEVIVDFLEGDPDQPIIIGSVHNAENKPPHTGVVSGFKSNTHKGRGFNEMTLDDTAGKEKVNIHAQYDMETTVEHDKKVTVKSGNRSLNVDTGTNTETIKGNASLTVQAGSRTVSVSGGSYEGTASAAVKLTGQGSGVEVTGNGGPGVKISGTPNFDAIGASKASIDSPVVDIGRGTITIHGTGKVTINGDGNVEITGPEIKITGSSKITIASGGSGIEVTPGGIDVKSSGNITLTGAMVKVNG